MNFDKKDTLYQRYLSLLDEIMKHKWIESEKRNRDIGLEAALIDWMKKHRKGWIDSQRKR